MVTLISVVSCLPSQVVVSALAARADSSKRKILIEVRMMSVQARVMVRESESVTKSRVVG